MTEQEYLEQVSRDLPGGKPPSRFRSFLLLAAGSLLILGLLFFCRANGFL